MKAPRTWCKRILAAFGVLVGGLVLLSGLILLSAYTAPPSAPLTERFCLYHHVLNLEEMHQCSALLGKPVHMFYQYNRPMLAPDFNGGRVIDGSLGRRLTDWFFGPIIERGAQDIPIRTVPITTTELVLATGVLINLIILAWGPFVLIAAIASKARKSAIVLSTLVSLSLVVLVVGAVAR